MRLCLLCFRRSTHTMTFLLIVRVRCLRLTLGNHPDEIPSRVVPS
jgi:hypothetical protein